jgi:hypothetical protein
MLLSMLLSVVFWLCRDTMDWVCTCRDLEAAAGCSGLSGRVACAAWAPVVGRTKEVIAVARDNAVRILGLSGNLLKPDIELVRAPLLAI